MLTYSLYSEGDESHTAVIIMFTQTKYSGWWVEEQLRSDVMGTEGHPGIPVPKRAMHGLWPRLESTAATVCPVCPAQLTYGNQTSADTSKILDQTEVDSHAYM